MVLVVEFFTNNIVLIYLVLLIAGIFAIRRFLKAKAEKKEAIYGIEMEIARRHYDRAVAAMVTIGILGFLEMALVVFLLPALPALFVVPTATGNLGGLPGSTLPGTPDLTQPNVTETKPASGCVPGQIAISSPEPGDQIDGKITIMGSADIPDFGFYKYEYTQVSSEAWITIQAGREPKRDEALGDWETSGIAPGDYLLRLVVSNNSGESPPPCVIPIRVMNP